MRIGRIEFKVSVRVHPRPKPAYGGRVCDVCGALVKGGEKTEHMREAHPVYDFITERRATDASGVKLGSLSYVCFVCKKTAGGVKGMVEHYRKYHPELLKGDTK